MQELKIGKGAFDQMLRLARPEHDGPVVEGAGEVYIKYADAVLRWTRPGADEPDFLVQLPEEPDAPERAQFLSIVRQTLPRVLENVNLPKGDRTAIVRQLRNLAAEVDPNSPLAPPRRATATEGGTNVPSKKKAKPQIDGVDQVDTSGAEGAVAPKATKERRAPEVHPLEGSQVNLVLRKRGASVYDRKTSLLVYSGDEIGAREFIDAMEREGKPLTVTTQDHR